VKPSRICHVVPQLDRVGGYELAAATLARYQARHQGLQPVLLTQAAPGRPARELRKGCEIHRLPHGLRRYHPAAWWRNRRERIDLVHVHAMHRLSGLVAALARRDGIAVLVKVATPTDLDLFAQPERLAQLAADDETLPRDSGATALLRRAGLRRSFARLAQAQLFLAPNDAIATRLAQLGLPGARLGNGVDTTRFAPPDARTRQAARAALGLQPGQILIAAVGRLVARKRFDLLIAALARLPKQTKTAPVLHIAGDGPRREELRQLARESGLAARVHLPGTLADVRPLLAAADLFAHASAQEGQPNAVLEAGACGLPLLLSDIPGHRELCADAPAAVLVAGGEVAAWTQALARLVDDGPARRAAGDAARSVILRDHSLPVMAEALRQTYAHLLAAAPAARRA